MIIHICHPFVTPKRNQVLESKDLATWNIFGYFPAMAEPSGQCYGHLSAPHERPLESRNPWIKDHIILPV